MSDRKVEEIKRIKEEAEGDLLKIPGVTGVGVGYQSVDGVKTDKLAILVYVGYKASLKKDAIPAEIKGFPTEIIERDFKLQKQDE
jgi:hypothetical protein